jgi:hypothetical protein
MLNGWENMMTNRFSGVLRWLFLVMIAVGVGCRQEYKQEEVVPRHPLSDPNFAVPKDAFRALEVCGGRQAWAGVEKLDFECVVTFHRKDGDFYLTEQRHEIYPSLNSIRISGKEPQGELFWQLSPDGLCFISEGVAEEDASPPDKCGFAYAVLSITTAPMRLADKGVRLARGSNPVRIEGLWYYPIARAGTDPTEAGSPRPQRAFYQNADNSIVDTIHFEELSIVVRGYDYREIEKGGVLVPTKIEIFAAEGDELLKDRLVRIDYDRVKSQK